MDSSSSDGSFEVQDQPVGLSAETILAVRQYNQQIASYTLQQWNVAKLESERKDRERRKRRADYLAQQQREQTQQPRTANAVPPARPLGSAGMYGIKSSSEGPRPNGDGPLMMVSKRRTDRALSGTGSVPSAGPVQSGIRHSHDQRYASQHSHSYDIHADIASVADQRQHQHPEQQQSRPRRHQRSSHADQTAFYPISPIPAASTVIDTFEKPRAKHIESMMTGLASSVIDDSPLTPPPRAAWQNHDSPSTPPITIPAARAPAIIVPSAAGSASSGGSSSAPRSASPARALGFAAHLGMTSISTGPSTSALSDSRSTSTSDPTSEGSSRMSSFSEHNGFSGIKHSLKMVTEEDNSPYDYRHVRPTHIRAHRTSLGATTAHRGVDDPCPVESAIGTLRRMTVSGDETGIFGALDQH